MTQHPYDSTCSCVGCRHTQLAFQERPDRAAEYFSVEELDAAADELADGEARYRHALEVMVETLAGGDVDAALAYGREVLRGCH